jgi:hypothetical protein
MVAETLRAPSQGTADRIWLLVVVGFIIVFVGSFLAMAVYFFYDKKVDTLLTVFTTSAAFLAGLLAPSPVGTK